VSVNLYVGNIPVDSTADDLRAWFSDFGTVTNARLAWDRHTNKPRGFGFVEMIDGAENAIDALNGFRLDGHRLAVNVDRPPR
jgi:RNA recognition motif-containing protein